MLLEITCPVCHFEHIPGERDICPQCDSDLTCFKLLDALQEKKPDSEQEPKQNSRMDLSQESGPPVHHLPEDGTWDNEQNGCADAQGRDRDKFPWMWPATGVFFLLMTLAFFCYIFYDLSEIKNMIQQNEVFLIQTIGPREKESAVNHDRLEAISIKLVSMETQAQKLYELLQKNGVRLNKFSMKQEKVFPGTGADTGNVEDTLAADGVVDIKMASAGGVDSASLNVSAGDAGGVMDETHGPDQLEEPTTQDKPSGNQITLNPPSLCFKIYRAKENDTLWDISQDLYGRGVYYPVLLEHNPDLRIFDISSKDTLRYLCDKRQASRIYKKITALKKNRRYWKYTLRPGDTRSIIAERYCPKSKGCFVEDAFPEIGQTIGIFLE